MQDTDKVRTSLLNFMVYSNIEASLTVCEQEMSEKNNSKNNAFYLLSHLVLHKNITVGENGGITQNKIIDTWKKTEIWNLCPSSEWNLKYLMTRWPEQLRGEAVVMLAFLPSEAFL